MSLSIFQKKLLQQNVELIKPDFHQFTKTFHTLINEKPLQMTIPSQESINQQSYILYCALNKVINHLDDLPLVIPFIHYMANNLSFLNVNCTDIDLLCDAFWDTLQKQSIKMNSHLCQAWSQAILIFKNIVKSYLFSYSNVVSLAQKQATQLSS